MLGEPLNKAGEEATKQQTAEIERLIQQEGQKIQAYEAAFGQIKEATGVADVNEVIQKFLSQEETHQNLLQMTRDSQGSIDSHREALDHERAQVSRLQYALVSSEEEQQKRRQERGVPGGGDGAAKARQELDRGRARWKRIWRTQVNCKAAVQHILELLDPLRLEDEIGTPLTDETMLPLLQQVRHPTPIICCDPPHTHTPLTHTPLAHTPLTHTPLAQHPWHALEPVRSPSL